MHELSSRLVLGLEDVLGVCAVELVEQLDASGQRRRPRARLVRFQRTVRLLERHDGDRFAEIAQRCGYYDQAHMNREFRELAGTAPGEFVARLLPNGLGVAIDWLERAYGFERHPVHEDPGGTVVHAELRYGDGLVMLGAWRGEDDHRRPGQGWAYVAVDNLDDHLRQAREAGAEIVDGPQHEEYGSFYGARDPEGTCGAAL